jgi:serine/threonine protein kinase
LHMNQPSTYGPSVSPVPTPDREGERDLTVRQLIRAQTPLPVDAIVPPLPELATSDEAIVPLPGPGDRVLHFELVEEIGRGAFARVFLARQQALANRSVVLKLTATPGGEPQRLARLQHPNIVPLYSVHQVGSLYAVCMPYLGRVTLCRAVARLAEPGQPRPRTGRDLFAPLFDRNPPPLDQTEPLASLARMTRVEAALWLAAQLAGGLAHAHARGILHRDLKPANVLLTDAGVPMILDFNMSADAARPAANG